MSEVRAGEKVRCKGVKRSDSLFSELKDVKLSDDYDVPSQSRSARQGTWMGGEKSIVAGLLALAIISSGAAYIFKRLLRARVAADSVLHLQKVNAWLMREPETVPSEQASSSSSSS